MPSVSSLMNSDPARHGIYDQVVLSPSSNAIRLLVLEPVLLDGEQSVNVKMFTTHEDEAVDYTTLSYSWRAPLMRMKHPPPDRLKPIICNGRRTTVLENLYNALCRLARTEPASKKFWIDYLCINQSDNEEKNRQVQRMADIYQEAEETIAWLGPADEHSVRALNLVRAMGSLDANKLDQIRHDDFIGHHLLPVDCRDQQSWVSMARFFRRSWFSRTWIVQEVLLSRNRFRVLCGDDEVNWGYLVNVSHHLLTRGFGVKFADSQFLTDEIAAQEDDDGNMLPSHGGPAKLSAAKQDLSSANSFLTCLIRSREYDCSDPRDKVFSLHAVLQQNAQIPAPDYQRGIGKIYTEAAVNILASAEGDLHLLAHVEGKQSIDHELPSWVPDWSQNYKLGLAITGYERYNAAKGCDYKRPQVSQDHRHLTIRAYQIGVVSMSGESKREVLKTRAFPDWLKIIQSFGNQYEPPLGSHTDQSIFEVFWRTLIRDTDEKGQCPANETMFMLANSFRAWVVQLMDASGSEPTKSMRDLFTLDPTYNPSAFDLAYSYRLHLRLFRTKEGHLGLGTEELKEGDTVWIVAGSRVPLILRKTQPAIPFYELVGGAYLHGVMQGETVTLQRQRVMNKIVPQDDVKIVLH